MITTIESPTRVTLALDIIQRLNEGPLRGYHELGIVKHQIALADTLHFEPIGQGVDVVECEDGRVPRDGGNICVKACGLLRQEFGRGDFFRITIEKRIPVMGGLAGGSANAAAALRALDRIWGLGLTRERFAELGRRLGMDVPFFFAGGTAFDSEATGVLEAIDTNLKFQIILAVPDFGIGTKEAYGSINYSLIGNNVVLTEWMVRALKANDFETVVKSTHNDFELSVFHDYPRLKEIRDKLLDNGCAAACMSGSGSTIIGIVDDNKSKAQKIADSIDCSTIITETLA
jgi:4-diphosphocytidyl-2-C-methyl-D-erythritol kinase